MRRFALPGLAIVLSVTAVACIGADGRLTPKGQIVARAAAHNPAIAQMVNHAAVYTPAVFSDPDFIDDATAAALAEHVRQLEAVPDTPCRQWYDEAIAAGWTRQQWVSFTSWVMHGESTCVEDADNPGSSAAGLMQVLESWAASCGISRAALYTALPNLRCALYVYNRQGPTAWEVYNNA